MLFSPGYLSPKSLANMRNHKRPVSRQEHMIDSLIDQGIIVCGSPDTVRKKFINTHRLLGFSMNERMTRQLVIDALRMAWFRRRPARD